MAFFVQVGPFFYDEHKTKFRAPTNNNSPDEMVSSEFLVRAQIFLLHSLKVQKQNNFSCLVLHLTYMSTKSVLIQVKNQSKET